MQVIVKYYHCETHTRFEGDNTMATVIIKNVLANKKSWNEEFNKRYDYVKRTIEKTNALKSKLNLSSRKKIRMYTSYLLRTILQT